MKKLLFGVMVAAVCISATVATLTASATAPSLQQQAEARKTVTMQNAIPVTKVDKSAVASSFGISAQDLDSKSKNYYQDSHKNVYMIDNKNRLSTYWENDQNNSFSTNSITTITQADAEKKLINCLSGNVPNNKDFKVDTCYFDGENYNLQMKRTINTGIDDFVSATVRKNGDISSITIKYCNVDSLHPITDSHKKQLDKLAQQYLTDKQASDSSISSAEIKEKFYNLSDDCSKVIGVYTFSYSFKSDNHPTTFSADAKTFEIGA
ncbi:MAG TPA: hypothetical protein DEB12_02400 [Porphyromonadaceae bacterium]|jgi:hypothetical protein|nr:hypothetical protein [Porphyromonadaceae bacterium]